MLGERGGGPTFDEDDVIEVVNGRVEIAYPFTAQPTRFVVRLAAGGERDACCAIDALGMAPERCGHRPRSTFEYGALAAVEAQVGGRGSPDGPLEAGRAPGTREISCLLARDRGQSR